MTPKMTLKLGLVVVCAVVLSACGASTSTTGSTNPGSTTTSGNANSGTVVGGSGSAPDASEKQGTTTITGVVSAAGGRYFIQVGAQTPQEIDSYSVELDSYVAQTVTVTGQYSGDTLFVTAVQ